MKLTYLLIVLIVFPQITGCGQNNSLYPFNIRDRWGFVNADGGIVIEPIYRVVQPFSEGLASVRKDGHYGYIDLKGRVVIPFEYDYAEPFCRGIARVFKDNKPYFVDVEGRLRFQHNYEKIDLFDNNGLACVETHNGHIGLIDNFGNLVLDTLHQNIGSFKAGYAVVYGLNHDEFPERRRKPKYEVGLVNSFGQQLIDYGKFSQLDFFSPGIYRATLIKNFKMPDGSKVVNVFVDTIGTILFAEDERRWSLEGLSFEDGLCEVSIPIQLKKRVKDNEQETYAGMINTKGQLVFSDSSWKYITPFANERAFAFCIDSVWRLIDKHGKIVDSMGYDDIITFDQRLGEGRIPFIDGRSLVRKGKRKLFVDLNGKIIQDLPEMDFEFENLRQKGSYLIFEKENSSLHNNQPSLFGYYNYKSGQLVKPTFLKIDMESLTDELIQVSYEDSWGYVDQQGKTRWKSLSDPKDTMREHDIDYMSRGYYYASSPYRSDLAGFGGWGGSENESRHLTDLPEKKALNLQLEVDTTLTVSWKGSFKGYQPYLKNMTADSFFFEAQDSRLYLNMQALDTAGCWRDIEYLPNSWCGNSYHQLYLAPGEYWEFKTPSYHGEFKTKLRLKLVKFYRSHSKEMEILYSNTVNAGINPAQFWRRGFYRWGGIMDPYWD